MVQPIFEVTDLSEKFRMAIEAREGRTQGNGHAESSASEASLSAWTLRRASSVFGRSWWPFTHLNSRSERHGQAMWAKE